MVVPTVTVTQFSGPTVRNDKEMAPRHQADCTTTTVWYMVWYGYGHSPLSRALWYGVADDDAML